MWDRVIPAHMCVRVFVSVCLHVFVFGGWMGVHGGDPPATKPPPLSLFLSLSISSSLPHFCRCIISIYPSIHSSFYLSISPSIHSGGPHSTKRTRREVTRDRFIPARMCVLISLSVCLQVCVCARARMRVCVCVCVCACACACVHGRIPHATKRTRREVRWARLQLMSSAASGPSGLPLHARVC
jgi:hypothetical protein